MSDPEPVVASADDSASPRQKPKRLRRLFLLLGIVAVLWAVFTAVRVLQPTPLLDLAREAVQAGRFYEAADYYVQHLARNPEDWGVRVELGMVLQEIDRPQALGEFRKVPRGTEARLEAVKQIARICFLTERFEEAEEALKEWEQAEPASSEAQLLLAEVYFRQSRPAVALPHAQKSADLNPKVERAHTLLAEVLDDLKRPAEMVGPLREALALNPDNYAIRLNLSYALSETGQASEAKEHAEWCLSRNPEDVHARRFLAVALRDEGEPDEALLEIERALELVPGDLECRLVEAELLLFQRRPEEAMKRLEPLYVSHSDDRRVAALLGRAAAAAGRTEQAKKYHKQVQKLSE